MWEPPSEQDINSNNINGVEKRVIVLNNFGIMKFLKLFLKDCYNLSAYSYY